MNIHFVGYGNMARALAKGFATQKKHRISASSPSLPEGLDDNRVHTSADNLKHLQQAEVIILAVKPQTASAILKEIGPHLPSRCLLISVMTGIDLEKLASCSAPGLAIVRAMPNSAVSVEKGVTGLAANVFVDEAYKAMADELFSTTGMTLWFDKENDINTITALSGSGPAYIFYFVEAMTKAGVALGFNQTEAASLSIQTLQGAAALLDKTGLSPCELRKKITSPAGTTAAALAVFESNGLDKILDLAMKAAYDRALELNHPD